ncbi:MAG: hypothetical protein QXH37_02615 [Candidatus Bathyarchaeia archaeon]
MSQRDTKKIRKERIKELLKKFGALSTTQLTQKINETYQLHYNKKTIQRDISELMLEGSVKPNPPIGREQTYCLTGIADDKATVTNYLLNRLWKEEAEIEKEFTNGDIFRAYQKAHLLFLKLPPQFKEKLFKNFKQVKDELEKRQSIDLYLTRMKQAEYLRQTGLPLLIENITSILNICNKGLLHDPRR